MDDRPIGVFDSGFGGLTVARALIDLVPDEQIIYIGDSARYPYGSREPDEVRAFSKEIVTHLVTVEDVKMVIVACNTASAVALEDLRFTFDVPIVGVIEPGLRSAARVSRSGRIGVIGTVGTIASNTYQLAAIRLRVRHIDCYPCPGFVEFVERGELDSEAMHELALKLLSPLRAAEVDTLLLGCTHYPFLARTIADVMGRGVVLVSSAEETAFDVKNVLSSTGLGRRSAQKEPHRFLSSGDIEWFADLGQRLLGPELGSAEPIIFGNGFG